MSRLKRLQFTLQDHNPLQRLALLKKVVFAIWVICAFCVTLPGCLRSAPARSGPSTQESSLDEASRKKQALRLFEILDVNEDGRISRQEAASGFRYLIAGGDSKLDAGALALGKSSRAQKSQTRNSARRPSQADADRALEALFVDASTDSISRSDFEKIVVASRSASTIDPFSPFLN